MHSEIISNKQTKPTNKQTTHKTKQKVYHVKIHMLVDVKLESYQVDGTLSRKECRLGAFDVSVLRMVCVLSVSVPS